MILVTGSAGFIGFHLCQALLKRGDRVIGVDCINEYYDPALKRARLQILKKHPHFSFYKFDLCNNKRLTLLFSQHRINAICHLAAQAGVRYSLTHPFAYQKSNNEAFLNIIEQARAHKVKNFVYASSSSVYGLNSKLPFAETDRVETPISLYAATKRSNELVAHSYSHLFGIPTSGLRFFTVYGPWGRPDMALFLFTSSILAGKPIEVFNKGKMLRNFTYIDDIVNGIILTLDNPRPFELYNIGNSRAEALMDFIDELQLALGKKAKLRLLPMQAGDVVATRADIRKLGKLGYKPHTNIKEGIASFVKWYREYYKK